MTYSCNVLPVLHVVPFFHQEWLLVIEGTRQRRNRFEAATISPKKATATKSGKPSSTNVKGKLSLQKKGRGRVDDDDMDDEHDDEDDDDDDFDSEDEGTFFLHLPGTRCSLTILLGVIRKGASTKKGGKTAVAAADGDDDEPMKKKRKRR